MADQDEIPKWAKASLEKIKSISPKIEAIKKEGKAEIRRGLEKVEEADKLRKEVDYLGRVLSQSHDPESWLDEIITVSGTHLDNSLSYLDQSISRMARMASESGDISEEQHLRFAQSRFSTDSSEGAAIYLGASLESRFSAIEPRYTAIIPVSGTSRLTSRDALYQELRITLVEFGDEYTVMLDGSEAALGVASPDSLQQAAHSMRDCFQQLIEYLAPSRVVKSQPWFEKTDGAPGGVSRYSRLRYMLYGSGNNVDESTIQQLDELAEIAKRSLDLCIARAHGRDLSLTREEVLFAVDQARNDLLNVLKLYRAFREKGSGK